MEGNRAAKRYAKAILGMAEDKSASEQVYEDMKLIANTIAASSDLKVVLVSPVVKDEAKKNALEQIFKNVNAITTGSFNLLLENRRIDILKQVADKYIFLYNEKMKTRTAVVTTAVALTPDLETKVKAKVRELTGNDVILKNEIDENIIGGFILRIGDIQYNTSIKNKLNNLKRQFKNESYVSKL